MAKYFRIDVDGRGMAIIQAASIASAKRQAIEDEGRQHVTAVREATKEDVAWFRAMGGSVRSGFYE